MMRSFCVFNTFFGFGMPRGGSPERHPTSRGHVIEPRLPHVAALGVPGERTGVTASLGERAAPEVALPGPSCLIPGMVVDHKK